MIVMMMMEIDGEGKISRILFAGGHLLSNQLLERSWGSDVSRLRGSRIPQYHSKWHGNSKILVNIHVGHVPGTLVDKIRIFFDFPILILDRIKLDTFRDLISRTLF